jgi:hypothetical protein
LETSSEARAILFIASILEWNVSTTAELLV